MASRINITEDITKIIEFLSDKSESMTSYIKNNIDDDYMLILKNISHSDLTSSGKRTKISEPFSKNYLYYLTVEEMEEIDNINPRPFATAHQSNIGVPKKTIYEFLNIEDPHYEGDNYLKLNDYADIYLVNDTLKYFNYEYTQRVFEKLNKNPNWRIEDCTYTLENDFTPISLSIAAHGIGVANDQIFHKLRRSIFKSDTLIILMEKARNNGRNKMFVMLEKNPKFFTLIGEGNSSWEKYLSLNDKKQTFELLKKDTLSASEDEKTRKNQSKWRDLLANEMMSYTTNDDEIFCPLTYITANYMYAGTLFRASHIKAFSECNMEEAFDINNGILMVANADALFDKHLITIDENGEIIFSYLLKNEYKLIQELKLTERVFKAILNPKRVEYLKRHNEIFKEKEIKRKTLADFGTECSDEEFL